MIRSLLWQRVSLLMLLLGLALLGTQSTALPFTDPPPEALPGCALPLEAFWAPWACEKNADDVVHAFGPDACVRETWRTWGRSGEEACMDKCKRLFHLACEKADGARLEKLCKEKPRKACHADVYFP